MRLTILGPHGGELPGCRSTCFLVDDRFSVDAGALTSTLSLPELLKIDDILLTHSHFDHVKDLPLLADVLVGRRKTPVVIHSSQRCIAALKKNLFNDVLWPNFTEIPNKRRPVFKLRAFRAGATVKIGRYRVKSIPVSHPVECCGYLVSDRTTTFAISGDTGPTERLWKILRTSAARVLLLETSFPNALQELADVSGHLTPRTMEGELKKLNRPDLQILLYHLKPAYVEQLRGEVAHLPVRVLETGDVFEL